MIRSFVALLLLMNLCQQSICAQEKSFVPEDGFVSMFDGKSLAGWTGSLASYAVENEKLVCITGGTGNLLTEKQYTDFVMAFEFKLTEGANNGLGIRCPKLAEGSLHLEGIELQILDDTAEKYKALKPYQYHGSAYGLIASKQGSLEPVGKWNHQEVTVKGRNLTVMLNGTKIVDANFDEATKSGTLDGQLHPGLARRRGHIALLGHGDRVDFRNLQIMELPLDHTSDSLETVKKKLTEKSAVLVDVRELAEWNEAHVSGAISLPISSIQKGLDASAILKIVPQEKVIYTHCRAGRRALAAADELLKQGYDVRPLKPGIQELLDAGFPKAQ
jgi:rhodanese-related sulfurtransferase